MSGDDVAISVIVLAYGEEKLLDSCVRAILDTTGPQVEVIVVDNGAPDAVNALPASDRLTVLRPGANLGYAEGCNTAARQASGRSLVFCNSDAVVAGGAIDALVAPLDDELVGITTGSVRLADDPDTINSVGNPVHFLGVAWAGSHGEPAADHTRPGDVTSATGAFFAIRRARWVELGGFPSEYFAYHEDTELSLRSWQRGWAVRYVPTAVVLHDYEFSRNPMKLYLLERNRWLTVLTVYPRRLLALVLPALVLFDLALLGLSAAQGWLPAKVKGWRWLLAHRHAIAERRSEVQAAARIDDRALAALLVGRLTPTVLPTGPALSVANAFFASYWAVVVRILGNDASPTSVTQRKTERCTGI